MYEYIFDLMCSTKEQKENIITNNKWKIKYTFYVFYCTHMRYISGQELLPVIQPGLVLATVYVTAQTMEPHDDHWGGCLEFHRFRPKHYWVHYGLCFSSAGIYRPVPS